MASELQPQVGERVRARGVDDEVPPHLAPPCDRHCGDPGGAHQGKADQRESTSRPTLPPEPRQRNERRNDLCLFGETGQSEHDTSREKRTVGATPIGKRKAPYRQSSSPHFDVELAGPVDHGDTGAEQPDRTEQRRPLHTARSQPGSQRGDNQGATEPIDQPAREQGRRAEGGKRTTENEHERGVIEYALWAAVPERRIENA